MRRKAMIVKGRQQGQSAAKKARNVKPDRFNPGTWAVFNGLGECLASGFDTEDEAKASLT